MIRTTVRLTIYFIALSLLQVAAINHIHLFGIITPFIYLYLILKLPADMSRSLVTVISFLLGMIVDVFSNTQGMHAAACTFAGFVRTPLLERMISARDLPEGCIPSCNEFGFGKFMRYTIMMANIHHAILFAIEAFSFFQPLDMIVRTVLSAAFTSLLIYVVELFNISKPRSGG